MKNLEITSSQNSPHILCDAGENTITIEGESRPESVRIFYQPLFDWVANYQAQLEPNSNITIKLNLNLSYFNSSSVKIFLELISSFSTLQKSNPKISFIINWFHDETDEDMIEAGKEFENMIGFPLCFVSKKEDN